MYTPLNEHFIIGNSDSTPQWQKTVWHFTDTSSHEAAYIYKAGDTVYFNKTWRYERSCLGITYPPPFDTSKGRVVHTYWIRDKYIFVYRFNLEMDRTADMHVCFDPIITPFGYLDSAKTISVFGTVLRDEIAKTWQSMRLTDFQEVRRDQLPDFGTKKYVDEDVIFKLYLKGESSLR